MNDNWRIRPNLTLNLGVRYEYTTVPYSERLQALNAIASVPGLINFASPQAPTNDFAPRIGIAWSPGTSGRTSIRAGFSEAFDVLFDNLGLLTVPPEIGTTNDCAPNFGTYPCPTPFLAGGAILPGTGGLNTFTDPLDARANTGAFLPINQKLPKSIEWSLGIQHTFWNDYTVEVRYLGTRGIHLPTQIQLDKQPKVSSTLNLPTYLTAPDQATLDASTVDLATIKAQSALVPAYAAAGFGATITSYQPWSTSTYHGLAIQVTKRFTHGLQFVGAYTYSHLIDDATAEVFSTVISPRRPQNSQDLSADRSNSILDHRHRLTFAAVYDEPFFRNSSWFLKNTLGNWEFAPIYTYQSGQWATAQSGVDANLNGDAAPDRDIYNPSGVSGLASDVVPLCNSTVASCPLTLAAANSHPAGVVGYLALPTPSGQLGKYIQAGYGTIANIGRNTLQLAPINDIDLTALKRFTITERFKVEFQAQAFNLLNHPQYVGGYLNDIQPLGFTGSERNVLLPNPVINVNNVPTYTSPTGSFNTPSTKFASNARALQLALKIYF